MTPLEKYESRVVRISSDCWLWRDHIGKHRPYMSINGKAVAVAKWAYAHFVEPIPEGRLICHRCSNEFCVRPDHLYAGTVRDNVADSRAIGTWIPSMGTTAHRERARRLGKSNTWSKHRVLRGIKIPAKDLAKLVKRYDAGETLRSIAESYKCSRNAVCQAIKRQRARAVLADCERER